jgi:hypothetical protein
MFSSRALAPARSICFAKSIQPASIAPFKLAIIGMSTARRARRIHLEVGPRFGSARLAARKTPENAAFGSNVTSVWGSPPMTGRVPHSARREGKQTEGETAMSLVEVGVANNIGTVTMNYRKKRNALCKALVDDLVEGIWKPSTQRRARRHFAGNEGGRDLVGRARCE